MSSAFVWDQPIQQQHGEHKSVASPQSLFIGASKWHWIIYISISNI